MEVLKTLAVGPLEQVGKRAGDILRSWTLGERTNKSDPRILGFA